MIKSLFDADDESLPKEKTDSEVKTFERRINKEVLTTAETDDHVSTNEERNVFKIPEDARFFAKPDENPLELEPPQIISAPETKIETPDSEPQADDLRVVENPSIDEKVYFDSPKMETGSTENSNFEDSQPKIFQTDYKPESTAETVHNSGLAYSAAIVLFASIVFMMMLGWFVGQLIGNSTGGIVGGIILGAVIGFVQFFRITSSIFKK
jgi:F0F1-type ATP synthase assembly protein I